MPIRPLPLVASAVLLTVALAGCAAPDPAEPDPVPVETDGPAATCPSPLSGGYPAVQVQDAQLLGASDLPADVCAYADASGDSIWLIAQPYDADFPNTLAAWLAPLGWTSEEVGTWGDGDLLNLAFTPPTGIEINQAFGHAFSSYPDSVSFNMGIDQDFLDQFGAVGSELAIFTAYR